MPANFIFIESALLKHKLIIGIFILRKSLNKTEKIILFKCKPPVRQFLSDIKFITDCFLSKYF